MSKHALLSPSSAHRWMHCTPSARLTEGIKSESSEYAKEGTVAHLLAEVRLPERLAARAGTQVLSDPAQLPEDTPYYGPEMEDYINSYMDVVESEIAALEDANNGAASVLLEQKVSFAPYIPESFGTADVIILCGTTLEVIDLKYGQGVRVDAPNNPQIMSYALGALLLYTPVYDIATVKGLIVQPRLHHVSGFAISATDLLKWAEDELAPKAKLAFEGEGELSAGTWCRFCPIAATCRTRAELNIETAKQEFGTDATQLTTEELADLLPKLDEISAWCTDLKKYALNRALHGDKLPGYKVVLGAGRRHIPDEHAAITAFELNGATPTEYMALKSITNLEKIFGKRKIATVLEGLVEKKPGAPQLVPESDKREEYIPAEAKFTQIETETDNG